MRGDPVYPKDTPSEVVGECLDSWRNGRPWTDIRPLRLPSETLEGHSCKGSQGKLTCGTAATMVQYNTPFAEPAFYCGTCGTEQFLIDESLYVDCQPTPEWVYEEQERRSRGSAIPSAPEDQEEEAA